MNDKFDELAKGLAQSVTRRGALKKFGVGIAANALACPGLKQRLIPWSAMSLSANNATLYRYTTTTNQVKETPCSYGCLRVYASRPPRG